MNKLRIGDKVVVTKGKNVGKEGEITSFKKKDGKIASAIVKGVNIVKRSIKPNPQFGITGGVEEFEAPIKVSNIMYLEDGKPTKVAIESDKSGKNYRISKKSGKKLD